VSGQAARRFYKEAAAVPEAGGGFRVELDSRPVKTPVGVDLMLPTGALADAVTAEWQAQSETINPASMPMMQLACTALDRVAPNRETVIAETAGYGAHDLLCYRADAPPDLVERQDAHWQPVLDWLASELGAALVVTTGIIHRDQPEDSLDALNDAVGAYETFALTAVVRMTQVYGSLGLGLAVAGGRLSWEEGLNAALLDEIFQAERWGEDREAIDRRRNMTAEVEQAARFLRLVAG